ncbi:MarR family transcriptional regulator [Kribbella sp. NBC_01245]|uniref:MarR family winged helix-turn-helix transcriptional regulator n=1 Tax=Kribbella sp. NBC_01245 TaxID=2903578 RepID=UPI002E2D7C23|nr:MarR family transcriptional regulator [Kribbella sp. NBC_01245]
MAELADVFNDLVRLEIELWDAVDARLKEEFELPIARFEFLRVIDRIDGCRVQDIARELSITVGGTSKLVDRIEASGYCVRGANPDDRRSSILKLTKSGQRVLTRATKVFQEELDSRLGEPLTARELETLARALTKLRRAGQALDTEGR